MAFQFQRILCYLFDLDFLQKMVRAQDRTKLFRTVEKHTPKTTNMARTKQPARPWPNPDSTDDDEDPDNVHVDGVPAAATPTDDSNAPALAVSDTPVVNNPAATEAEDVDAPALVVSDAGTPNPKRLKTSPEDTDTDEDPKNVHVDIAPVVNNQAATSTEDSNAPALVVSDDAPVVNNETGEGLTDEGMDAFVADEIKGETQLIEDDSNEE